jgi:hypothetical protein
MALMIWTIEVLAIPATNCSCKPLIQEKGKWYKTYVGKIMVWRIILHVVDIGMSTVSLPEQGAPPTNVFSFVEVQQRWHMFPEATFLASVFTALPAIMRKP